MCTIQTVVKRLSHIGKVQFITARANEADEKHGDSASSSISVPTSMFAPTTISLTFWDSWPSRWSDHYVSRLLRSVSKWRRARLLRPVPLVRSEREEWAKHHPQSERRRILPLRQLKPDPRPPAQRPADDLRPLSPYLPRHRARANPYCPVTFWRLLPRSSASRLRIV